MRRDGAVPTTGQRVILTLRGPGLETHEASAVVEAVGEAGMFRVRLRSDVEPPTLRTDSGVTVDRARRDGLWRLQTRVLESPGRDEYPDVTSGRTVTLAAVGEARHVDIRRFRRAQVWSPIRCVVVDRPPGALEAGWTPDEVTVVAARRRLGAAGNAGRVFNLGEGGLAFVPDGDLRSGSIVFLHIEEPALDIHSFGRIVWARRAGSAAVHAGVSFLGLSAEDEDVLLEHVLAVRRERRQLAQGGASTARAATTA